MHLICYFSEVYDVWIVGISLPIWDCAIWNQKHPDKGSNQKRRGPEKHIKKWYTLRKGLGSQRRDKIFKCNVHAKKLHWCQNQNMQKLFKLLFKKAASELKKNPSSYLSLGTHYTRLDVYHLTPVIYFPTVLVVCSCT